MSALDKEKWIREFKYLALTILLILVALKIAFFKESFLVTLRTTLAITWMFLLPGLALMYYWKEKLDFLERLIIGFAVSTSILGISSYYLALFGFKVKYHLYVLPLAMIIIAIILIWHKEKNNNDHKNNLKKEETKKPEQNNSL